MAVHVPPSSAATAFPCSLQRAATAAPRLQLNHHHRAFTLPSPSRVHLHAPKPRRLLLFHGGVFLLHQNDIHNVVVVSAARGDEGDESGLDEAEVGIKGGGFQVRAFVKIVWRSRRATPEGETV